jgi:hypothetical protein
MNNYFYIIMTVLLVLSMLSLSGCEQKQVVSDLPIVTQPDDESVLEREKMAEQQEDWR